MKDFCIDDFSALVGIDWADQKHDVCELSVGDYKPAKLSVITSRPEAIHEWVMDLRKRFTNKPIAVACELKKGPLIYALLKYEFITIFPLHPATVAKMRKAFLPSGAKSDPDDAQLQAELLRDYMHKLTPIVPDTAAVRALAQLVECRRKLVQDRVDLTNSLTYYLKNYYPQVLDWFKEKGTHLFCYFITKWPSLRQVKRARKTTIVNFMQQHNVRYPGVIEQRLADINSAIPLTEDEGVVVPNQLMAGLEADQLSVLLQSIDKIEQEIKKRYRAMADRKIFDSFPGAGPQFAPRLLVAFGSERDRYESASAM